MLGLLLVLVVRLLSVFVLVSVLVLLSVMVRQVSRWELMSAGGRRASHTGQAWRWPPLQPLAQWANCSGVLTMLLHKVHLKEDEKGSGPPPRLPPLHSPLAQWASWLEGLTMVSHNEYLKLKEKGVRVSKSRCHRRHWRGNILDFWGTFWTKFHAILSDLFICRESRTFYCILKCKSWNFITRTNKLNSTVVQKHKKEVPRLPWF